LAALLAVLAGAGWFAPASVLDWQPALAWAEPWRAFSAAFVHWSALHLGANMAGTLVVGAFGVAARVPPGAALAWLAAWPLTQLGLLLRPDLLHYGGLSGVLHAGVAIAAFWLVLDGRSRERWIGGAVLAGLVAKIVLEAPWGAALRQSGGWDIAIAPFAHATGALAGAACALCVRVMCGSPLR
jgi:rhomboid family GlyGly-CTERM serine protease